ncbi:amidohydrolase [Deinococcus peraridilitoris]|uniref:Putative TIM-barrel fold metal-dependent hydrolase n=1 Tax=Deinococcus peraridilitoris (strain DSM 19664 / LMG 22246 / CIP 109416 / KR-200) TaxID=937777 RepID=L0A4A2_DEIPD|nr:amidohydrolase [Deinococcus peraridilitoris]AFZ68012.1 putative TIM-barrel fold metal-dependent hydrolase [Deinococcus peraridilitoris DSM 19664]
MTNAAENQAPPLQLILADVRTLDPARPRAEGVLVAAGRVLKAGTREELLALAPRAEVLDHRGSLLTPGLTDAHVHLVGYGFSLGNVNLAGARSVAEVQARVRSRVQDVPEGSWVQGNGFTLSELGLHDYPSAAELDEVSPRHPVLLFSRDLHSAWANSLALRLAGVSEDTPDPEGGRIVRPLGTLLEYAKELVTRAIPAPTPTDYQVAAKRAVQDFRARGFTSVHTMGYEPPEALQAVAQLAAQGELPLRVWACVDQSRLEDFQRAGMRGGLGRGSRVEIGGLKFFADGALGSRTAWLTPPGFADGSGEGMALHSPELIRERGRAGLELGLTPVTHAIGDRANTEVLDAYADLAALARQQGVRLRIEHAQHLRPQDIARFGELGVTASVQPIHLLGDGAAIRELLPHLEATSYAFRQLLDTGALLAFGSDAPVAPPDVGANFRAALTRTDDTGTDLAPQETLSEDEVLFAYTRGGALAAGWEDYGVVRPGSWADFTLWDRLGGEARALTLS